MPVEGMHPHLDGPLLQCDDVLLSNHSSAAIALSIIVILASIAKQTKLHIFIVLH